MRRARKRAAFTLVELLVVIGIIAILAGMLMPALQAARTRAQESSTRNLIHQCEVAATGFFNDYGDYPPSTWPELLDMLEYDTDGDGTYEGVDDPASDDYIDFTAFPNNPDIDPDDSWINNPAAHNEGIEVFVAAVATRTGGPYLEPGGDQLGNTDRDSDHIIDEHVRRASNWFFGSEDLFELVDFWGNPLVYVHNRDYANHDGFLEGPVEFEDAGALETINPEDWATSGYEALPYVDAEGEVRPVYARARQGTATQNWPRLNSFQLYSWGKDMMPGRSYRLNGGPENNYIYPGWTAGRGTLSDWDLDGVSDAEWVPGDGNLCNWEE
ncbi:MAG: type II secretion system protein [Candidatus Brocadiia bacterium]